MYFSNLSNALLPCDIFISVTLVKSGGGFFPLHRFDSAHTAFLIIVRRFCLANNLQEEVPTML